LKKIKSNSAFPVNFKYLPLFLLILFNCAGRSGQFHESENRTALGSILSIRAIDSAGPVLDGGVSLKEPVAIAVNGLGDIYITDSGTDAVLKLSSNYKILAYEGGISSVLGGFNRPAGLAYDAAMNLYIADSGNHRIQMLDRNLRYAKTIDEYFDDSGKSVNFDRPEDVAVDIEGNLWVADNDKVLKINQFNELEFELSYTSDVGFGIGKATSISASRAGLVAICDSGNRKLFIVSAYGNLISEFSTGQISSVCWESENRVWTASDRTGIINAYDISGNRLFAYSPERPESGPISISFDGKGLMNVIYSGTRTIVRYEVLRNSPQKSK